jgi:hypothetical protein
MRLRESPIPLGAATRRIVRMDPMNILRAE